MRSELLHLQRNHSTKSERRISEILKKNHIKFYAKRRIGKYEVDFLIGKMILEVDGAVHRDQPIDRDQYFLSSGYLPVHIDNGPYDIQFEQDLIHFIELNG